MEYYLISIAAMSVVTFIFYGIDKNLAVHNGKSKNGKVRRISEKTLLGLSFFGGAVGGALAMSVFRHKTKHWYFVVLNAVFIIIHAALFIVIFL